MASYDIKKTRIGTGDTANIADDKAIPIYDLFHFPSGWSKAIDFNLLDLNRDVTLSILHGKVSTDAQLSLGFGLAGPSWAGAMDVEGKLNDNTLQIDITNDEFVSGMLIGADASFTFNFSVQYKRETLDFDFDFSWSHPFSVAWKYVWHDLIGINETVQFDLLSTLATIAVKGIEIVASLAKLVPGLSKIAVLMPSITLPSPRTFNHGITDHVSNSSLFLSGLEFPTSLEATFNFVDIVEVLGKTGLEVVQPELIPVVEVESKMEKVLKWIKPTFGMGPVLGLKFTTLLRISGINAYWGAQKVSAEDISTLGAEIVATFPSGVPDSAPDKLGIAFDHRPTVDFIIGWYISLSWLKIFSVSPSVKVSPSDISDAFAPPAGDAYTYEINNNIGSTTTDDVVVTKVEEWIFG